MRICQKCPRKKRFKNENTIYGKKILKKQGTIGILILLCLSVIFTIIDKESISNTLSKEISGKVIKVYDGDTITLLHNNQNLKIRLYGIDAPESNQSYDIDVNAEQVKNGYAWAYRKYSNAYTHLEIKARAEKRSLWKQNNPVKPSEFRKNQKEKT